MRLPPCGRQSSAEGQNILIGGSGELADTLELVESASLDTGVLALTYRRRREAA